jgi:hypothetical protein
LPKTNGKTFISPKFRQDSQTKRTKLSQGNTIISGIPKTQLAASPGRLKEDFDKAAWTWTCSTDMGMQHGHGHTAWTWTWSIGHEHAALDMDMLLVKWHAAFSCICFMPMSLLHVLSMQHGRGHAALNMNMRMDLVMLLVM